MLQKLIPFPSGDAMPKVTGEELLRLVQDAKRIQLQGGIRLSESSCKLGNLRTGKLPTNATQAIKIELQVDRENKQAAARITLKLIITYDGPEDAEPPFSVTAAFTLRYAIVKPFPKKKLEQTVRNTAILTAWPYWREFVQSMTLRMGLPSFAVPLLNVTDLQGNLGADENEKSS